MALSRVRAQERSGPTRGHIRAITIAPQTGAPQFTAVVQLEPTASTEAHQLRLVWLGQREVVGLVPGALLDFWGRPTEWHGKAVIFNPRYDLLFTPLRIIR